MDTLQRHLVSLSIYATLGDLELLAEALEAALEEGVGINQVKEAFTHLYAYAGFPRALNAINTLIGVLDSGKDTGRVYAQGRASNPVDIADRNAYGGQVREQLTGRRPQARYAQEVPYIDDFLKEHLFADLFSRDALSFSERELITVSVLAALGNVEAQLNTHLGIWLATSISSADITGFEDIVCRLLPDQGDRVKKLLTALQEGPEQGENSEIAK